MEQEQQVVQLEQHIEQGVPHATCPHCGRNSFRGNKGVRIHQSKSALCREMRRLADARTALLEAEQAQEVQVADEQVAQSTAFIEKAWAGIKEFWGFILMLTRRMFKITYSFLILCLGLSNIYFLYLYLTEKAPIINRTTYLVSPNFEEEFRVM